MKSEKEKAREGLLYDANYDEELLREREAEIERLKKRQAELEFLRQQAYEAQRRTEMEIAARGGTISVPRAKLILSPNIRTGGKY